LHILIDCSSFWHDGATEQCLPHLRNLRGSVYLTGMHRKRMVLHGER